MSFQLHFRYTICIELVFNRRTFSILRIFYESFSLGSLLNQYQTYQGNPCGVYPDLSSFTGSGVYPDLSSFTGSGVIQKTLQPVSSDPLLVRITSSGIKASALDTGSILSNFYFFFVICLRFLFCSVICVLVCVSACVLVCVFVCVLVCVSVCVIVCVWFMFLFRYCFALVLDSLCFKILFEFCF